MSSSAAAWSNPGRWAVSATASVMRSSGRNQTHLGHDGRCRNRDLLGWRRSLAGRDGSRRRTWRRRVARGWSGHRLARPSPWGQTPVRPGHHWRCGPRRCVRRRTRSPQWCKSWTWMLLNGGAGSAPTCRTRRDTGIFDGLERGGTALRPMARLVRLMMPSGQARPDGGDPTQRSLVGCARLPASPRRLAICAPSVPPSGPPL
jgi:hypothetical protein